MPVRRPIAAALSRYLTATDPEVAKRTWQVPMDEMTKTKTGHTHPRGGSLGNLRRGAQSRVAHVIGASKAAVCRHLLPKPQVSDLGAGSGQKVTSLPFGSLWKIHFPPERNEALVASVSSMNCM